VGKSIKMHTHDLKSSQFLKACPTLQYDTEYDECVGKSLAESLAGRTIIIITASWQSPEESIPATAERVMQSSARTSTGQASRTVLGQTAVYCGHTHTHTHTHRSG